MIASLIQYVPFVLGVLFLSLPVLAGISLRLRGVLTRAALFVFGSYVIQQGSRGRQREQLIRAARLSTMYRVYASRTLLYATLFGLGGSLVGLYVMVLGLRILALPAETLEAVLPDALEFLATGFTLPALTSVQLLVLFLLSSATFGTIFATSLYVYRWSRIRRIADERERRIEESLPRTVAFMFALSRSGMSPDELIRILSKNSKYFGESANEFVVSLRNMDISGADFLSATQEMAQTTPSSEFANFAQDFATVLRTGRPTSEYFREKYEQYQQEKRSKQEQILEQISALAEAYVALLVAGPLFFITILVTIGLLIGGTLGVLRVFVYFLLPLASIGFVVYVGRLTASLGLDVDVDSYLIDSRSVLGETQREAENDSGSRRGSVAPGTTQVHPGHSNQVAPDGGVVGREENVQRLRIYNRYRTFRQYVTDPVRSAVESPLTVLYVVTPVATLYVLVRAYLAYLGGNLHVTTIDDYLIQAILFGLGTFAVAEYLHSSRKRRIETALPDFLDRLADQTEAGMTLTRSILEMDSTSVPGLEREIEQLQTDIEWGGRTTYALHRFAERTKSVFVSRAVILKTNALHASGDIGPVLRIAAEEAQIDRRLGKRRRQELLVYQIIIYLSILVFIGIVIVLNVVFLPSLPSVETIAGGAGGGSPVGTPGLDGVGGIGGQEVDRDAYTVVLFHSVMIQGVLAGFVAGKMGEGNIEAGAKHATVILALAYAITLLV